MSLRGLTIFVLLLSIAIYAARRWRDGNGEDDGPFVELPLGRLSGTEMATRSAGRNILAFKGIPYARKVVWSSFGWGELTHCGQKVGSRSLVQTYLDTFTFMKISLCIDRPPVGELRFARTEPLTGRWDGVRQATEFGNRCPQECERLVTIQIGF